MVSFIKNIEIDVYPYHLLSQPIKVCDKPQTPRTIVIGSFISNYTEKEKTGKTRTEE